MIYCHMCPYAEIFISWTCPAASAILKQNLGCLCSTDCVSVFLQSNPARLKGGCTHCVQQSVLTERVPTMYKTLNCILN